MTSIATQEDIKNEHKNAVDIEKQNTAGSSIAEVPRSLGQGVKSEMNL